MTIMTLSSKITIDNINAVIQEVLSKHIFIGGGDEDRIRFLDFLERKVPEAKPIIDKYRVLI